MSPRTAKTLTFVAAATLTSVFFIKFCATVFRCGCASLWSGADARCNIHMDGVPHCPWCAHGLAASTVPYLIMVAAQAAIAFHSRSIPPILRLLGAVAAFPVVGAILAAIYRLVSGY